jgi:hypothetical protein
MVACWLTGSMLELSAAAQHDASAVTAQRLSRLEALNCSTLSHLGNPNPRCCCLLSNAQQLQRSIQLFLLRDAWLG